MNRVEKVGGRTVLILGEEGPVLGSDAAASDLMGEAMGAGAQVLVLPVARLSEDFLKLSSGLAAAVLQKFVNYRLQTVIVGDITSPVARSAPLRDFVRESNRGTTVWFVADMAELEARLAP